MLMQRLRRFMIGRYGVDRLNLFLLVLGVVLGLTGSLFFQPLYWLSVVIDCVVLFRFFSRNISSRRRENSAFIRVSQPVVDWLALQRQKFALRGQYKYFKCPSCKQDLRAPRGRGEIEVTCQRCKHVFKIRC